MAFVTRRGLRPVASVAGELQRTRTQQSVLGVEKTGSLCSAPKVAPATASAAVG